MFGTLYATCAFIEGSMFISHGIWYLRTREIRKRAEAAGMSFGESPEAIEWQNSGFDLSLSKIFGKLRRTEKEESEPSQREEDVEKTSIEAVGLKTLHEAL
jgi:hypothetical protein